MNFGKTVKSLCERRGWTLSRLSKESGVPSSTLNTYIAGREPKLTHLRKIAAALEAPLFRLAFGEPDPHGEVSQEILHELFSGDIRVTVHRIQKGKEK